MSTSPSRLYLLAVSIVAVVGTSATAAAQTRGQGTMLVKQSTDCSGTGNTSTVALPFSVLFTGFTPGDTGMVTAYTQPGGEEVGHREVVVDANGEACERVTGDVPPGQYRFVYDFGWGTGKQKVIRITGPEPTPSPSTNGWPNGEPCVRTPRLHPGSFGRASQHGCRLSRPRDGSHRRRAADRRPAAAAGRQEIRTVGHPTPDARAPDRSCGG